MSTNILELVTQLEALSVTYQEASEILEVHEAYTRRLIEDANTEATDNGQEPGLYWIHGRPVISRAFVEALRDSRAQNQAGRANAQMAKASEKEEKAKARAIRAEAAAQAAAQVKEKAPKLPKEPKAPKEKKVKAHKYAKMNKTATDVLPEPTDASLFEEV